MTTEPLSAVHALIGSLQAIRERPVIVLHAALSDDTVPVLYDCLRQVGRTERLDLVLATAGGSVTVARQVALLLREFTGDLTILVGYRARSAGTLLCLSADRLVLGPLAELSPVDALMGSAGDPGPNAPPTVSAEDVRAFRSLAEDWFGITRAEDRLQLLALLATRIFPASLAALYRSGQLVREVADELLTYQLGGQELKAKRQCIIDRLVGGYHAHEMAISRRDARELGLQVVDAAPETEELLWQLWRVVRRTPQLPSPSPAEQVTGIIAAAGFGARLVFRRAPAGNAGQSPGLPVPPAVITTVEWEIAE